MTAVLHLDGCKYSYRKTLQDKNLEHLLQRANEQGWQSPNIFLVPKEDDGSFVLLTNIHRNILPAVLIEEGQPWQRTFALYESIFSYSSIPLNTPH